MVLVRGSRRLLGSRALDAMGRTGRRIVKTGQATGRFLNQPISESIRKPLAKGLRRIDQWGEVSPLRLNPVVDDALDVIGSIRKKNYLGAAGKMIAPGSLGSGLQVSGNVATQGTRLAKRAKGGGLKKRTIGFLRGAKRGLKQEARTLRKVIAPGSVVIGEKATKLIKKSPYANTKLGKLLTTDVKVPLRKAGITKKRVRELTGGVFNSYTDNESFFTD